MSIPETVASYLHAHAVPFTLLRHAPTRYSMETAEVAHVPGRQIAKGVMLEDGSECWLAVIPATHRIDWVALGTMLRRPLRMMDEPDLPMLFRDCRLGAVPPMGAAYGVRTVVELDLVAQDDLYMESGDHEHLVHVDHRGFSRLMSRSRQGHFSYAV